MPPDLLTDTLLIAAGGAAWKAGSLFRTWLVRRKQRRIEQHETEEEALARFRRELAEDAEKARARLSKRERLYDELRQRLDRLGSQLSDEKQARRDAEEAHQSCSERLTRLETRVAELERCRLTCQHVEGCVLSP